MHTRTSSVMLVGICTPTTLSFQVSTSASVPSFRYFAQSSCKGPATHCQRLKIAERYTSFGRFQPTDNGMHKKAHSIRNIVPHHPSFCSWTLHFPKSTSSIEVPVTSACAYSLGRSPKVKVCEGLGRSTASLFVQERWGSGEKGAGAHTHTSGRRVSSYVVMSMNTKSSPSL